MLRLLGEAEIAGGTPEEVTEPMLDITLSEVIVGRNRACGDASIIESQKGMVPGSNLAILGDGNDLHFMHYCFEGSKQARKAWFDERSRVIYSMPWRAQFQDVSAMTILLPDCGTRTEKVTKSHRPGMLQSNHHLWTCPHRLRIE